MKAKARFLALFSRTGNLSASAAQAKCGRRTVYDWLSKDPAFKKLYLDAHEDALDTLEEEARRRAVEGVVRPVFQGGEKVGSVREYSDTLLIALLKGKRPETFRERVEPSGPGSAPLPIPDTHVRIYTPENGRSRTASSLPDASRR